MKMDITSYFLATVVVSMILTAFFSYSSPTTDLEFSKFLYTVSATSEGDSGGDEGDGGDGGGDNGDGGDDGGDKGGDTDDGEEPDTDAQTEGDDSVPTDQPDLTDLPEEQTTSEICNNGMDDDGDGATDSADGDCGEKKSVRGGLECYLIPGVGFTDRCSGPFGTAQDPGLTGLGDPPVWGPTTEKHEGICGDGLDNDEDGLVDEQDSDCTGTSLPELTQPGKFQTNPQDNLGLDPSEVIGNTGVVRNVPSAPIFADQPTPTAPPQDGTEDIGALSDQPAPTPQPQSGTEDIGAVQRGPLVPNAPIFADKFTTNSPPPPPGGDGTTTSPPGGDGTTTSPPGGDGTTTPPPGGDGTTTPPPGGDGTTTAIPTPPPTQTIKTIIKGGSFTVHDDRTKNTETSTRSSSDCTSKEQTLVLGPSVMETGEARLLLVLDPCILADGSGILNLPDAEGIQLVAANLQGNQATQSVIVPIQRVASLVSGQTLYNVELKGEAVGEEPVSGKQAALNGNVNALLLWNNAGRDVEFNPNNSVSLHAIIK